jgi:hypothetical protein
MIILDAIRNGIYRLVVYSSYPLVDKYAIIDVKVKKITGDC